MLSRVDCAARIVGVDDNDGSRGGVSQRSDAGQVGLPATPRQQVVEPGLGARDLAGHLVRREARARQQDVGPWSPAEHRGDGGDGARAAHRHEHVVLVGAVARAGGQVVGDRAVGWLVQQQTEQSARAWKNVAFVRDGTMLGNYLETINVHIELFRLEKNWNLCILFFCIVTSSAI